MGNQATVPDRTLLLAWIDGERDAGQVLIERHYQSLFTFFYTRVDPDTSADLTQSTFVTLCENGPKFLEVSSVRAYLLGIARWKLVAHFRRGKRVSAHTEPFDESLVPPTTTRSLTSQWVQRERGSVVVEALRQLPFDYQVLLELKEYEGFTAREIAEVFEIPPGTVATRIRRARQELAAAVERMAKSGFAETTSTSLAEHLSAVRNSMPNH